MTEHVPGQMDVDECIDEAVKEDCTCGLGPGYGWKNHAQDCPVLIRGRSVPIEERARESNLPSKRRRSAWEEQQAMNEARGPLSAADVVKRKLTGKPPA